mgnify:CR=1 FL=1|jgi:hypothetical protein
MKQLILPFFFITGSLLLCQCKTMEDNDSGPAARSVSVNGTVFYPDETNVTYQVPAGAQVIGAGGTNCRFVIEAGGSVTAHAGTSNTFEVKSGGHFRGFTHPATNCTVKYEPGAVIEQEQVGEGTQFLSL